MKNIQPPSIGGRIRRAAVLSAAGIAAFCTASLFAQTSTSNSNSSGSPTYPSVSSSSSTMSGSSATGSYNSNSSSKGTGSTDSSMLSRADKRFVTKATELNTEEIHLSELAAQQASNPEVRSYAQQLVTEHNKSGTELGEIASHKGITAAARDDYDQRSVTKLSKKSGKDFDEAYVEKMADAHEDAIDTFEKEAKSGKDPELQAFASKMLPTLREHEQHAKTLEKTVK